MLLTGPPLFASDPVYRIEAVGCQELRPGIEKRIDEAFSLARKARLRFREKELKLTLLQPKTRAAYSERAVEEFDSKFGVRVVLPGGIEPSSAQAIVLHEVGHFLFFQAWQARGEPTDADGLEAMNELWADLLAVSVLADPDAVYKGFRFSAEALDPLSLNLFTIPPAILKERLRVVPFRRFSVSYDSATWNEAEIHSRLSPVRGFLGEQLRKAVGSAKLLEALFEAVYDIVEKKDVTKMTTPELNQLLIEQLRERLAIR